MPIGLGLGLAFLFQAKKKLGFFMLAILLLVVLFIVGWRIDEVIYHFVKSTKLGHEKIGDIYLYDPVDNEFAEKYGSYRNIDNVFYHVTLEFRKLTIGINNNDKITFISTVDPKMATINTFKSVIRFKRLKKHTEKTITYIGIWGSMIRSIMSIEKKKSPAIFLS